METNPQRLTLSTFLVTLPPLACVLNKHDSHEDIISQTLAEVSTNARLDDYLIIREECSLFFPILWVVSGLGYKAEVHTTSQDFDRH